MIKKKVPIKEKEGIKKLQKSKDHITNTYTDEFLGE